MPDSLDKTQREDSRAVYLSPEILPSSSLAAALIAEAGEAWEEYTRHPFVEQLGAGSLPGAAFRHYLVQDYLFLQNFSRAYALAVFKSDTLEDMRQATTTLDALLNTETKLHVDYCKSWGLSEAEMAATPEASANMAYTRFVLEKGLAGDLLDLLVALAPCVVGYGEIGLRLKREAAEAGRDGSDNPYRAWVETYSGEEYLSVIAGAVQQIDRVAAARLGSDDPRRSPRWTQLAKTFEAATRLEAGFWQMGLEPARE